MSRYIEVDGLIGELNGYKERVSMLSVNAFQEMLEQYPTADVAEVRHGRWLKGDEMADYPRVPYKPWETYCSCCREIKEQSNDDFCGNCGASMDEVTE